MLQQSRLRRLLLLLVVEISEGEGKVGVTSKRVAHAWRGKLNIDISKPQSWVSLCHVNISQC